MDPGDPALKHEVEDVSLDGTPGDARQLGDARHRQGLLAGTLLDDPQNAFQPLLVFGRREAHGVPVIGEPDGSGAEEGRLAGSRSAAPMCVRLPRRRLRTLPPRTEELEQVSGIRVAVAVAVHIADAHGAPSIAGERVGAHIHDDRRAANDWRRLPA